MNNVSIVAGRSNPILAQSIFEELKKHNNPSLTFSFTDTIITDFPNGEIFVKYKESIRGSDVYIVQSFNDNPNKNLVETMILADTAFAASARSVNLILPTIYGARQDRKTSPRTPVTISTIAKMLKSIDINRVITTSLHAPQSSAAFFSAGIKFDNISSAHLFLPMMQEMNKKDDYVVVSPDVGGVSKARFYADQLNTDLAFADKRRDSENNAEVMHFVGDVYNRNCFIIDDMIDTGGSLLNVSEKLKELGAKDIYCLATHLILSNDAVSKILTSPIKKVFGTDSTGLYIDTLFGEKFSVLSMGDTFAKTVLSISKNESVSNAVMELENEQ